LYKPVVADVGGVGGPGPVVGLIDGPVDGPE